MTAARTAARKRRRVARSHLTIRHESPYVPLAFIGPMLVLVILSLVFPVLFGAVRSLFSVRLGQGDEPFVGLENYFDMLANPNFLPAAMRSIVFALGVIVVGMTLSIAFALALNQATRSVRFLRGVAILPYIVSGTATAFMFRLLFNRDLGVPNRLLELVGAEPLEWLGHGVRAMLVVIVAQSWAEIPLIMMIILAGLQTIDPTYVDAAEVDGAGWWQRTTRVTLPLVSPQLILGLILLSYGALNTFGEVLALTGGGPGRATETVAILLYQTAFVDLNIGQGMAIMMTLLLANATLTLVYLRMIRFEEVDA